MTQHQRQYSKNLNKLSTIRISEKLREKAEQCAHYQGISFSDFVRQSLTRNIYIAQGIEEEVSRISLRKTIGKDDA